MLRSQRGDLQIASAQWLADIPWGVFATLSFASPHIRPEAAITKFNEMIETLERTMRTRIGYIYAMERRSRSGAIVPLHIHAALVALKPIDCQLVRDAWGMSGANGTNKAQVEPYDPDRAGAEYIVKHATDPDCELGDRNLEFFNGSPLSDRMQSREAQRWREQLAQALSEDTRQFQSRVQIGGPDMKKHTKRSRPAPTGIGLTRSMVRDSSLTVNRDRVLKSAILGKPATTVVVVPARRSTNLALQDLPNALSSTIRRNYMADGNVTLVGGSPKIGVMTVHDPKMQQEAIIHTDGAVRGSGVPGTELLYRRSTLANG